ncbi:MAG: hypothetical protein PHP51_03780 [Desulfotomaculaceae bacterium]|nr:hypothetical protein [Desulfotomaculaceae bacterium]MDD4766762.1 hypothetical protein [Desulfotomaculaceae bacterium]
MSRRRFMRFHTLENLDSFFKEAKSRELVFKAHPISGDPERFRYDSKEQSVSSLEDGARFDSMIDFYRYVFQCDPEGYPNTEHIDLELWEPRIF